MAVGIESKATPKAGLVADLIIGYALDESDQSTVDLVPLPQYLGQRQVLPLLRHPGVEGIDAAVGHGIARRPPTGEDERQMRQSLLFPPGDVRDDVFDRPGDRKSTRLNSSHGYISY